MIGSLFLVGPELDSRGQSGAMSTNGVLIVNGILQGASTGQIGTADQEGILAAASQTPGGSALNAKQLLAAAGLAALVGVTIGYVLGRKKR